MSLDFDQLTRLEEAVLSQHRRNISNEEKEVQFLKIFKYFKSQMRHSYEYEKGRNDYSLETNKTIENKEDCNRIVKTIINEQCKYPLNRNDQVVTEFAKVERNHGQKANLYKFTIRKGKNISRKGEKDMFLGQLMVSGVPTYNENRPENRKVFISSDVPYCDRDKANEMKRTARLIREESSGDTVFYTRLNVDHNKRDMELLVKKKVGKKSGKWLNVLDHPTEDISEDLRARYKENVKIKKRTYVPKASRAKESGASKKGGSDTPSPVPVRKAKTKAKDKGKKDKSPPPPRRRTRRDPSSSEEDRGEPTKAGKGKGKGGAAKESESECGSGSEKD